MDIRERIKNVIVKNLVESKLEEEGENTTPTTGKPRRVTPSQAARDQSKRLKKGENTGEVAKGTADRYKQEYIKKRFPSGS